MSNQLRSCRKCGTPLTVERKDEFSVIGCPIWFSGFNTGELHEAVIYPNWNHPEWDKRKIRELVQENEALLAYEVRDMLDKYWPKELNIEAARG